MTLKEMVGLEEVQLLVARGQEQGFLGMQEIAEAVEGVSLDESRIEELYAHLDEMGVEVLEDA